MSQYSGSLTDAVKMLHGCVSEVTVEMVVGLPVMGYIVAGGGTVFKFLLGTGFGLRTLSCHCHRRRHAVSRHSDSVLHRNDRQQ